MFHIHQLQRLVLADLLFRWLYAKTKTSTLFVFIIFPKNPKSGWEVVRKSCASSMVYSRNVLHTALPIWRTCAKPVSHWCGFASVWFEPQWRVLSSHWPTSLCNCRIITLISINYIKSKWPPSGPSFGGMQQNSALHVSFRGTMSTGLINFQLRGSRRCAGCMMGKNSTKAVHKPSTLQVVVQLFKSFSACVLNGAKSVVSMHFHWWHSNGNDKSSIRTRCDMRCAHPIKRWDWDNLPIGESVGEETNFSSDTK